MINLNGYYQTPPNLFYQQQTAKLLKAQNEKKEIKYISIVAGLCVIAYIMIQNLLSILLFMTPLGYIYMNDASMQSVINIFFSFIGLLIPFGIGGVFIGKRTGTSVFNFGKPVSTSLMLSAVPLGFFVCLAGNYITSSFINIMDSFGFNLTAPDYDVPSDIPGRIVYAVSIAVVPALVEEFAIRGTVLQPLRKYGDKFAILASSLLFAILHGNLIQAPFALIAGIVLGYSVCITNSIWTGVLIHFCNNLYSVFTEFMVADITNEETLNKVYMITMAMLYAVSILGSVLFIIIKKRRKIMPSFTELTESKKMRAFVLTVPMIIALLFMFSVTSQYVSFE